MSRPILSIGLMENTEETFKRYFALENLSLIACKGIDEALNLMSKENYCLIMFDALSLSSDDTQNAIGKLRNITQAPLFVFASVEAFGPALEVGADVCAPPAADKCIIFSQAMALLRRYVVYDRYDIHDPASATVYRGDLMIDSLRHQVKQEGREIVLLPREFRLLAFFARNPGIVLTQDQIRAAIWLSENNFSRDVTPVIAALRQKLHDDKSNPRYIETVHGFGYRFLPDK